ncbi:stAR-related lipid transfer protein 9 [Pogoniulus pusillus]|uniref:stAR-related lipid transfer protein 9 n=1 Tax=Pogoniulus pusillus TaxID=488313 RepID=UPI0030B97687
MANVKVAVRVRPLSKRESAEGGRVIVEVEDKVAKVRNIKMESRLDSTWDSREKTVAFSFDYCYWSVDPEDPKYASQEMVFQDLGTSVLSGAFRGYNICLFAYGQTGSGKTYTMMGTPASIGLTPRICEGLFSRKDDYSDQTASCRVKVSFLEIYNERVRDLLKQSDQKKPYTLRVREHPETGPYVQGLTQHLVTDYKQVVELLEEGIAKRITAATHIHNASSRSHAIFTIHYTQAVLENNLPSEIACKINLVDLAGSERADPSYCRDRITEGANINKSLVTLGIVISTLAQNSQMFSSCQSINTITSEGESSHVDSPSMGSVSGARRPAYIPYRDSILTWLLKDSLGGNSKTIMIATISPASSSYNETMSTLRYASNAKNIINKPRVNEDTNVKLIRELREEIDRLKTMLMSFELRNSSPSWSDDRDGNLTELVLQNEMKIEQLTKDWTSKWTDRRAIMEEYSVDINKEKAGVTIDSSLPHLMAMDDDILSTGVVLYHLREGTTKIGRIDSDQDQDIVLQGRWIERDHCMIDNHSGVVTLRPVQGAHCTVNGCEITGSCRLSQGALVVLGKSHKFRFNHPEEAAILRQRRSISETSPILSCGALDWLNLDGSCTHSSHYILSSLDNQKCRNCKENKRSSEPSREIDAVHEEYKQKLRDQEAFHRKQIQQQQLYVEDLKQQILRGQIKAERELENDQALINQQIQENQQWLINENKRLAALQQREFAVQTESTLCAEAEVQSTLGLEICPSLLQQNKKRLVQLELLRRHSLKKAERNIRRKKVKFQLERIVKKQKLLEAKQNLEQLEACCLSEECVKQSQVLHENIAIGSSSDHQLQKRRRSLGSSSLQHKRHWCCNPRLPQVPSCLLKRETVSKISTSPNTDQCCEGSTTGRLSSVEHLYRRSKDTSGNDDLNDEKGVSFSVQRQLTEKQKASSFGNKEGAEKDSNDSAIMAYISRNNPKIGKLDDNPGQDGLQNQTSKGSSPDLSKGKDEPETFIAGTRMTKAKVLRDLNQPSSSNLEQSRAQVSNKKTRLDINGKGHRSSPENFTQEVKKTISGNPASVHLNKTAKNLKEESHSALPSDEKSSVKQKEFLMVATSVGNLTKMNTQTPLFYVEKKWHSAEMLTAGVSKTATDMLENWQEDDENEISDTDSSYSVDSLSCAYAKAFTEKPKQAFDRNKCLVNPEDSESDDSQMSQDSLVEKENKAKKKNKNPFHKSKVHLEPPKLFKSRTVHHNSPFMTYISRRGLGKPERSFSLDSLGDGEEMPAEDPIEESKSDSSEEMPAEIFWKLQAPVPPAIQTEEDHESRSCDRDAEGKNHDLKLSSSFYLDNKPQLASSNPCKQLMTGAEFSFVEQERSRDRRLYCTRGSPLLPADAWSSCVTKVNASSPHVTAPSSHENSEFQEAHLRSLSKPELWVKKDDLKQSAAEVSFVSGSKQVHSFTHLSCHVNKMDTVFSDTSEVPLPETATTASRVSTSGPLKKILKGWTDSNENSSLESQDGMSLFVSLVGPSSSFTPISAKHDYYEHTGSNPPEQEQLNKLSAYKSTSECTQMFHCLESASTADCSSLLSRKEEHSFPTTHPELPKDHNLKKTPFISVLPVQVLGQRNGCVDGDLKGDFFRGFEKDDLDDDFNNLMTKSSKTDSSSGTASVSVPAAGSFTGLACSMTSTQTSAVKQVQFGNHGQLFPRREIPTCCDEGFFLSDLTNKNYSLAKLQTSARQGAGSAVIEGLFGSGENHLKTMQEMDSEQISAEEITVETDFFSQKTMYRCNPLVVAHSVSYDQSAAPIEMTQQEMICMETSTDSLAEFVPEVPSFRDTEEHKPEDEDFSSLSHYEFKSKPVSKSYCHECAAADSQTKCSSQHISEDSTLCIGNGREESSESKEHNVLNSQALVQEDFSSKYESLVVNEVSYLVVNGNGKDAESFPAAVCDSANDFLPESNSSIIYEASATANLFQSTSETENHDNLLQHVTTEKGHYCATSSLTVGGGAAESCSHVNSGSFSTACSSTGERKSTHETADISVEFDVTILSEAETENKCLPESREQKEALFESDCPEEILLVKDGVQSESEKVLECRTNTSATVSQENNEESKCLKTPEINSEAIMVSSQNAKSNADEELTEVTNSVVSLGTNALANKSRQIESLPGYPIDKIQSVAEDRSREDFKDISLSQNPKKPLDAVASEVQCEFYTNLCLTHEEVERDGLPVACSRAEHAQASEALLHSGISFGQKEISEEMEMGFYSPEFSVAPKTTPSAVCSHTTDSVTQNTSGFLDTCEGFLQMSRREENVCNTEDVAATVLITSGQGDILSKPENEGQVYCSTLTEPHVPNHLSQEDKLNECEETGSEEQILTKTEGLTIMRQELIHTDGNVLFTEESPTLHQMCCDREDKEEIFNQFRIPERYLTASGLEDNMLLEDDSSYHDPTEMSEDGGSVDSLTDISNAVMKEADAYEYSIGDSTGVDQYRTEQECENLHITEDSHTYMSCSVQYPEPGTSENLNVSNIKKRHDICGLAPGGSRAEEEKVHLMDLIQMARTDKEKQMFVENSEEAGVIILQNLNELFPENKESCQMTHSDSKLNETIRESQWVSTCFSRNSKDTNKQQSPPATLKSTEKTHQGSFKGSSCQSVTHVLYLGITDDSHLAQDIPTALKDHTKPPNSSAGTGAVLPYYETLMESEVCVGTPATVNTNGEEKHLSVRKNVPFQQTRTTQDRHGEESFLFNTTLDYAVSGHLVSENISSTPCSAGHPESETVVLKQEAKENLDFSETKTQNLNNAYEDHSADLMVNKLSKDCLDSTEDTAQEKEGASVPYSLLLDNSSLLSSSEEEVMKGLGGGEMPSLLEVCSQKTFHSNNTTERVSHSGSSSQYDEEETFLSTNYTATNSKNDNVEFSGVAGCQPEPSKNQGHVNLEELCVDQMGSTVSKNASAPSEGLDKSPCGNLHYSTKFVNCNRILGTSEYPLGLLNHPSSSADALIAGNRDKGENNAVPCEETKYIEGESADLSVSPTFPDISQRRDEKKNNSAVAEARCIQNNKLPGKVAETDQKEEIIQGSFQNCNDIKENKISKYLEHCRNPSSVTVPELSLLTFQSKGQTGSKETKSFPSHFAEGSPDDTPFQSSKNFSASDTSCLLDNSKTLSFTHLEDSLQGTYLTGHASSSSASVCSANEGGFPQAFASVSHPSLTPFPDPPLTADTGQGETGRHRISHTGIMQRSPSVILQIQDTQSDKAVVFDEPTCASGSILLSLAKENRHCPVSDTNSTSYQKSAVEQEPAYGSNHQKFSNATEVDQQRWVKFPPQEACTEHTEKALNENSFLFPSLSFWGTGRTALVQEGRRRKGMNRNEEELHSNTQAEHSVLTTEQSKTVSREPVQKQSDGSSNAANELISSEVTVLENLCSGDVDVAPEHTCNSFSPAYPTFSRSTGCSQLYHTALVFEETPADLQDNCQFVPVGEQAEQVPERTSTDGGKEISLCKINTGLSIDNPSVAAANNRSTTEESTMRRKVLKSERTTFSVMNNKSTSVNCLPESHDLAPQESKSVQFRSKRSDSTTQNTKSCKQSEHRSYLQSHRLSAPAIAVFSDTEYTLEASSKADPPLLCSASKSLQDLNMSVEPPSPTEDDLHRTERFSKQELKNFLHIESNSRFQQRMTQLMKLEDYDPKNVPHFAARSQSSHSLKDCATQPPLSLLHTAHSSAGTEANCHSKSSSVAQCSEGKVEEAGYQPKTGLFLQDNKDTMRFSSSDVNPFICPWGRDESCKIGWKQYVFGSASDVSCNQIPLNLDTCKVMRCSSVDNGLNSQNSPFHSHLSSYATAKVLSSTLSSIEGLQGWDNVRQEFQPACSSDSTKQHGNVSSEILKADPENYTAELENPSAQPGNSPVQVDEIVLLYPSESERLAKKLPRITCEQGTQTATTGKYKRQRRHQRSYTDVSARNQETSRYLFHQPSSWMSMQNLSMHLSQLLQNTSELLGNLSQQNIMDNEQNLKTSQRENEEVVKATRSDSCTQTTADVGTQTELLEEPQSKTKPARGKMEDELRAAQAVNVNWKGTGGKIPKRKEQTLSLEERTQEGAGMRNLSNPDFHDSLASILEDSFMRLPPLPRTSTPILDFKKALLNGQQNVAFAGTRLSSATSSSLSLGKDGSSCTVASSTSQPPSSYTQDKTVSDLEVPAERKRSYKSTLLVDRASSPILTISASPSSQTASSRSACPGNKSLGYSSDASGPLYNQRRQGASPKSSRQPHVDNFSQTEADTESGTSRELKDKREKPKSCSNKKAAKEVLGQDGSKDLEQQCRPMIDTWAKRLCRSSSTLEMSAHRELLAGDLKHRSPLAHPLRCMYATRGERGSSAGVRCGKYVGNSDTALSHNFLPLNADLLCNKQMSTTSLGKTNASASSESLVEAASLQFRDFFWKNEKSCPTPLSDGRNEQTSFQDDNTGSVTESGCDTEIPLNRSISFAKPHRPRSYSLRDLPMHNKFSNWCGVKGSPSPSLLSLSSSVTDLQSQAERKPRSTQETEIGGNSQLCDTRSREIERLQRERAQVMSGIHLDLHQQPLTVELAEAKLNYGIGETDALLRVLQSGTADDPVAMPVKQKLYERHMKTIETLRKEREKRLQRYQRSRSLSPQKHLSLLQTLDSSQRDLDFPSRRLEYLQQLRRDVVENTRAQEPKRSIQHPSDIELLLRDYQRAREETKTEIARAREKLRERAEQEKRRLREQMFAQLEKEEAKLKTLASTSTLCTDSSLSLSSSPSSGYNSSNTATYTASNLSSQERQVSSGNASLSRDTRGRSAVRNSHLYVLEQLQQGSTFEATRIQPALPATSISCRFTHGLTISVSSASAEGYRDLAKHILANATTEVMAACSHNLRNLYTCQAAAGWKYQCTEKEVLVYYKVFPSATRHGFLGAGIIERPLPYVWGLVRDPGKRHLYDPSITTARVHKKVTSHIQLVYLVTDTSLCYLKQPRDFCCITVESKEENLSILAIQSVYDASMPHPCKEVVRGEILPSAWILEPDVVNGRDITRVIYMAQVDLGAPAIPTRLLSSMAKRQPLVIARLAHFLAG